MPNPVLKQGEKIPLKSHWASILGTTLVAGVLFNAPVSAQPLFQNTTISPGSSSRSLQGLTGGSVPANQIAGSAQTPTGPCVGYMDAKPNHRIVLTSPFSNLSIIADSPEDTTMVVKGPGGVWCNDDYEGKNPGMAGDWLAGTYNIWIGSYQKNQYYPYTLRITPGH